MHKSITTGISFLLAILALSAPLSLALERNTITISTSIHTGQEDTSQSQETDRRPEQGASRTQGKWQIPRDVQRPADR